MALHIHNTLSKKREPFRSLEPGKVSLYVCGPTVYDRAHIGNARPVVVFDVLYRLLSRDHEVTYVKNITDIDDKIIKAAKEQSLDIREVTKKFTKHYQEDMAALKTLPPTQEPRATDHLDEMIALIEALIEKGHAYAADGHVLFDTTSDETYGCLSNHPLEEMIAGARVEVAPYKKNPQDFVLWKPSVDEDPGWDSPWGRGRPGWHIECSAMSLAHLGESFDIHGGGLDLSFPHHENEIAQSTCALGKGKFAQYWMHNGMLMVNGAKMSKSLGNFYTVADLLAQGNGETIKFAMLSCHYRQPLDWQDDTMSQSKATLDGLYTALKDYDGSCDAEDQGFVEALEDDLNTPKAIARLHEIAKAANKSHGAEKQKHQGILKGSAGLMGLCQDDPKVWFQSSSAHQSDDMLSPDAIEDLIAKRKEARANKDFALSDQIRDDLLAQGVFLEDGPEGTSWKLK